MPPRWLVLVAVALGGVLLGLLLGSFALAKKRPRPKGASAVTHTLHDFSVERIDGTPVQLDAYAGKTLLVVNTASKCGLTPQYEGLEKLYDRYRARGFEVLAFPANDFLGQEPGTNAEIQQFCAVRFNTSFPLFAKIHVKGREIAPLYAWLTEDAGFPGDIEWNFAKFLVGPDGRVIARFHPKVDPLAPELIAKVEAALPTP